MSQQSLKNAIDFMENETQFHLGFLPTEQSNPLTRNLDREFARSTAAGVANLQSVDRNVLGMAKRVLGSPLFRTLVDTAEKTIRAGRTITFSGCGATGRLSILLECMWRSRCAETPELAAYADQVKSIMTGGDFALVKSVEFFEDYQSFGRRQVQDLGLAQGDMMVAITEGGETSSVLGSLFESLDRGLECFLLFNNPADLLAEHLERSRQAIRDPRVHVLDLFCGPMAISGSTRMQATSSEQLIAGAALEHVIARITGQPEPDCAAQFEKVLDELETPAARQAIADAIDFEAAVYRKKGMVTYFADAFLLDIFTDTTERSPTFMLPPFRACDDNVSPQSWAFVKNPLCDTTATWRRSMHRPLRCLEWTNDDYRAMGAPDRICSNPPHISAADLLKIQVGNENPQLRAATGNDAAVLITVGDAFTPELVAAAREAGRNCAEKVRLAVGGPAAGADFHVPCTLPETPLALMAHMAVKLVLNTISTGTMTCLGRVTGNWMSWVDTTNKKLIDRGTRLISEISGLDYRESCIRLFEAIEIVKGGAPTGEELVSPVQYVLNRVERK